MHELAQQSNSKGNFMPDDYKIDEFVDHPTTLFDIPVQSNVFTSYI